MDPNLIVFDFHGVLSLLSADIGFIKNYLKEYDKNSWYLAMKKSDISPFIMMPTLDNVISFFDNMKKIYPNMYFGIASMGEENNFMIDMMKFCFESQNRISPFNNYNVVGYLRNKRDKTDHINIITNNIKKKIKYNIILIDDSLNIVKKMTMKGICCILVKKYFTIEDWNKGCFQLF